jgi:adenosine deaminase
MNIDHELTEFLRGLPKAELHVHIEGTLEPEMMFEMGRRNGVTLPFANLDEIRAAYEFTDLQSFLDIYYQGAAVLITERDFYDLTLAYLEKAHGEGVRRAEIFFDPQTHTARGVGFEAFMSGLWRAREDAAARWGISSDFILCFLRHLPPEEAIATMQQALPHLNRIIGVGLDSSEVGHPPEPFAPAFQIARDAGLHAVAHAGEEGPPEYIWGALEALGAERIEHGATAERDDELMDRLASDQIPLTVCPISSLRLRVYHHMEDAHLKRFHDRGVKVTINSDDPAYFGGYVLDNYLAVAHALGISRDDLTWMARNSLEATFLPEDEKKALLDEFDEYVERHGGEKGPA